MALNDENGGGIPATMLVGPTGYPMYGGGNQGNNGFGDGNGWWIVLLIIIFAALGGNWGGNNNGNGAYGAGAPIIVNDGNGGSVQRGFDQAAVMGGLNGLQAGLSSLSTQLCGCCCDMQNTVNQGFAGVNQALCSGFAGTTAAVTGAQNALAQQMYANQIADMERSFAAQTANTQGMTALQAQLAQCCCDNRLATNDLKYTIATENCSDRAALSDGIRDLLTAQTANTQRILDQICQDKIDAKNDTIAQLRQELLYARGQASQDVQTAAIRAGQATTANQLIQEMRSCPVPSMPVYGMTPIFTCPQNQSSGCGCGCNGGSF